MNKKLLIFIITITVLFISRANADILYALNTPTEICSAATPHNNILNVYIDSYYNNEDILVAKGTGENSCSNTSYFNANLKNQLGYNYTSWTWTGRATSTDKFFVEGKVKSQDEYQYFAIGNSSYIYDTGEHNNPITRTSTLKPGETIYFTIDLSDNPISISNYQEVRVELDTLNSTSDINIPLRDSIAYYLYGDDNNIYGPYKLEDASLKEIVYQVNTDNKSTKLNRFNILSSNLIKDMPSTVKITKIKVAPYEYYPFNNGTFKLLNIKLVGYKSKYTKKYNTINYNNAENIVRHNIVNNMIANATIKWNVSQESQSDLVFYHHYNKNRLEYSKSSGKVYYGIPYVNNVDTTIKSFINKTNKGESSTAKYSYVMPTKYLKDETSYNGTLTVKKGDPITASTLYIFENNTTTVSEGKTQDLMINPFLSNSSGYFSGLDCSSSTFLAVSKEIPVLNSMAGSERYYSSSEVEMLGGLSINAKEIETSLRDGGNDAILNDTQQITTALLTDYYSPLLKQKYGAQAIYNAYALLIPGDIVDKRGHVRMATSYSHVVCNENNKSTNSYTEGFCDNNGGIDGDRSYVVTSEIGGNWNTQAERKFGIAKELGNVRFVNDDLWKITLNPELTDITNISEYLNKPSDFNLNTIYYFNDLYGEDADPDDPLDIEAGMYMPFRYKVLDVLKQNKLILPTIKTASTSTREELEQNKYLTGSIISNFVIDEIKYEINGETYYEYPNQTNNYSLYYDTSEEIKEVIRNIDYDEDYTINVSVKSGTDSPELLSASSQNDSSGYISLMSVTNTEPEQPSIEPEQPSNEDGDDIINPETGLFLSISSIIIAISFIILNKTNRNKFKMFNRI